MTKTKAKISQREFDSKYLRQQLEWVNAFDWVQESWKPKTALVDKKGKVTHLYTGQKFDSKYFDLVDKAWSHDHCDICSNRIEEGDLSAITGENIICDLCYVDFVTLPTNASKP